MSEEVESGGFQRVLEGMKIHWPTGVVVGALVFVGVGGFSVAEQMGDLRGEVAEVRAEFSGHIARVEQAQAVSTEQVSRAVERIDANADSVRSVVTFAQEVLEGRLDSLEQRQAVTDQRLQQIERAIER